MRAANCATTSATRLCPTAATSHSQIPTGPAVTSTSSKVAKIPTATEMKAKEIANTWKEPRVRFSSCRYPPASTALSLSGPSVGACVTAATSLFLQAPTSITFGVLHHLCGIRHEPVLSPLRGGPFCGFLRTSIRASIVGAYRAALGAIAPHRPEALRGADRRGRPAGGRVVTERLPGLPGCSPCTRSPPVPAPPDAAPPVPVIHPGRNADDPPAPAGDTADPRGPARAPAARHRRATARAVAPTGPYACRGAFALRNCRARAVAWGEGGPETLVCRTAPAERGVTPRPPIVHSSLLLLLFPLLLADV